MKNRLRDIKHWLIVVKHPFENVVDKFLSFSTTLNITSAEHFSDFINNLILGEKPPNGIQFEPFWQTCKVCPKVMRPNMVVKMEHLEEDLRNVWKILSLKEPSLQISHHKSPSSIAKSLYKELNYSQLRDLFDVFRLDHELFQYDPTEYFKLTNDFNQ
jgi:hypothetical protein